MDETAPSRDLLRTVIMAMITGETSAEDAADWASQWLRDESPRVEDPVVWNAITQVSGADLKIGPHDYLHGDADFHLWLDALESDVAGND